MRALLSLNVGSPDAPLTLGEALQMIAATAVATPILLWVAAWLRVS